MHSHIHCKIIYIKVSIDETDKENAVCTQEDYSAIQKHKILPFATTWTDLEGIMLC